MLAMLAGSLARANAPDGAVVSGKVTGRAGEAIAGAVVQLSSASRTMQSAVSLYDGSFSVETPAPGTYELRVSAAHFQPLDEVVVVAAGGCDFQIRLEPVISQTIVVTADVTGEDVMSPDPAVKVFATEDLLDANPGRPGAPISIPGYPIETASSGIKAPQYFAPGVAGDHGEPIAQYVQVGSYLLPNNLSANAHGNGYADPNIFIAEAIESVQVDGGAYNVREGNHALNLAAIYGLRSHLAPFFTLTGDSRDLTATAGMSPSQDSWVAMEGSYGNGFLDRLEHRKQFKFNGGRVIHAGDHTLTLFGIGVPRLRLRGRIAADLRIQCRGCGRGMDRVSRYHRPAAEGPDAHRARGAERRVEAGREPGGAALRVFPHLQSVAYSPTSGWD